MSAPDFRIVDVEEIVDKALEKIVPWSTIDPEFLAYRIRNSVRHLNGLGYTIVVFEQEGVA